VASGYLWSDLWGEALELSYVWRDEEACGVITQDGSGNPVSLAAPTAGPLPAGAYVMSDFYLFYASAL
jgi:hypothetical protein